MEDKKEIFKTSLSKVSREGFENEKNDCVVIAYAIAFNISYAEAHKFVAKRFNRKPGEGTSGTLLAFFNADATKTKMLNKKIIKCKTVNSKYTHKAVKYTVGTFHKDYKEGSYFILVRNHALAIVDGVIYDNSGFEKKMRRPIRGAFKIENND